MVTSRSPLKVKLSGFGAVPPPVPDFAAPLINYGDPKLPDDVWSLGATLCKYLVGLPWHTKSDDFDWCKGLVEYLDVCPTDGTVQFLKQLLVIPPYRRPSASKCKNLLGGLLNRSPTPTRSPSPPPQTTSPGGLPGLDSTRGHPVEPRPSRRIPSPTLPTICRPCPGRTAICPARYKRPPPRSGRDPRKGRRSDRGCEKRKPRGQPRSLWGVEHRRRKVFFCTSWAETGTVRRLQLTRSGLVGGLVLRLDIIDIFLEFAIRVYAIA
jgi:hypothetical protein